MGQCASADGGQRGPAADTAKGGAASRRGRRVRKLTDFPTLPKGSVSELEAALAPLSKKARAVLRRSRQVWPAQEVVTHADLLAVLVGVGGGGVQTFRDEAALEAALYDKGGALKAPVLGALLMWQHGGASDRSAVPSPSPSSVAPSDATTSLPPTAAGDLSTGQLSPHSTPRRWGVDEPTCAASGINPCRAVLPPDSPLCRSLAYEGTAAACPCAVAQRRASRCACGPDDDGSVGHDAAALDGWSALVEGVTRGELQDVGVAVKKCLRRAVDSYLAERRGTAAMKKYASGRRAEQVLSDGAWWTGLADIRPSQIRTDRRVQTFLRWRRHSLEGHDDGRLVARHDAVDAATGAVRYAIVLDLDETLIYARGSGPELCLRPGATELLGTLRECGCFVVVWTASTHDYSAAVLSVIDPEAELVDDCVYRHGSWVKRRAVHPPPEQPQPQPQQHTACTLSSIQSCSSGPQPSHPLKDLRLLGTDLAYTLLVDNSVECCAAQLDTNAVLVADYEGCETRDTLPRLARMITALHDSQLPVPDFLRSRSQPYLTRMTLERADGAGVGGYVVDAASTVPLLLDLAGRGPELPHPPTAAEREGPDE